MNNQYNRSGRLFRQLLVACLLFCWGGALAQTPLPPVLWSRALDKTALSGSFRSEKVIALALEATPDQGCAVLSQSFFTGLPFLTKLTASGQLAWTANLSLTGNTFIPVAVKLTDDGGYLVAGNSYSPAGPATIQLVKISGTGSVVFVQLLDLPATSTLQRTVDDLIVAPNGGFLVAGLASAINTSVVRADVLLTRVDRNGRVIWSKTYVGTNATVPFKTAPAVDGGYLVHAFTNVPAITGNPDAQNGSLTYNFRVDDNGTIVWEQKTFQATLRDIVPTRDGYVALGYYYGAGYTGLTVLKLNRTFEPIVVQSLPGSYENDAQDQIALQPTPDGGCIVVDRTYTTNRDYRITKYNSQLAVDWQESGGFSGDDDARAVSVAADGSFFVAGTTNSPGLFGLQPDGNQPVVWVRRQGVTPLTLLTPIYNCDTGSITFRTAGGTGAPITFTAPGVTRFTPDSPTGRVEAGLRNDPKPILITAEQGGQRATFIFDFGRFCGQTTPPPPPPAPSGLAVLPPVYDCQTGAITLVTTGGNGSPITFSAPGINRPSAQSLSGTIEAELRRDPKPILITALQAGQQASYTFDFSAYCRTAQPPVSTALRLLAPVYDCATGAFQFQATGGNGSAIEYAAAGITGWTANPNQQVDTESRTANDVQPFTLMARQDGVTVTYVWDLKAACGRRQARVAAVGTEKDSFTLTVLENPVTTQVRVRLSGVNGPALLELYEANGRLVERLPIDQIDPATDYRFSSQPATGGLFIIRAIHQGKARTATIIRQ
ncbi:hypothetical protein GCM10027578_15600 [Spirosoma luteolum]